MDLEDLRQQILLSNKTASEKAECLLLESTVNDLSKDEWRQLIAGIPADVKKEIGKLKSSGVLVEDDRLNRVLANTNQMVAILPALLVASDPFHSVSSVSNAEAKRTAYDFKSRLLLYYFNQHRPRLPPGLAQNQPLPSFRMQCMISQLWLDSNIVEAAHIVPKATNSSRWGDCVLGIENVWDERNGLLWAEPFEKAYHAHEIAVMYQSSSGTFRFRVLTDKVMQKRLSDYGKSEDARNNVDLQQHTFADYDDTDLLMPTGNMPFRRALAAHAAYSAMMQRHKLRPSLSFTKDDFDILSEYQEKGTTEAWVALQTQLVLSL